MRLLRFYFVFSALTGFLLLVSCIGSSQKSITILETTDVHGEIFPYDFIEKHDTESSLASVVTYMNDLRESGITTLLLDNGDNLQGQPVEYYYNFIDTLSPHINSMALNYMGYEAGTVGNHDIEAGHPVYDRLKEEYSFPLLAANAVDTGTGEPYFNPYVIIEKKGLRIAVFGLTTPYIPNWLPPVLYSGMEFRDMVETARKWMPVIKEENPDLVIGMFHSGWEETDGRNSEESYLTENATASVAYNIPGFDIIFCGHDHRTTNEKIVNIAGDTVLIIDGGSHSRFLGRADITFSMDEKEGQVKKTVSGSLVEMADYRPDDKFLDKFSLNREIVSQYVDTEIGEASETISVRDAYFGPSAFMDLIHRVQMQVSGADISFAAPLSFDVQINKGPLTVSDMFKLYRFENMLYTISLTGEEVIRYLEFSYSGWLNTMKFADDNLLLFRTDDSGNPVVREGKGYLKNTYYNFDSAFGINYTVDVSKSPGSRVSVISMADGTPFEKGKNYSVAVNSYRANGGGGHLYSGAGLTGEELRNRYIRATGKDLRFYIMDYIMKTKNINPSVTVNWMIIPEKLVQKAKTTDYKLLFGTDAKQ